MRFIQLGGFYSARLSQLLFLIYLTICCSAYSQAALQTGYDGTFLYDTQIKIPVPKSIGSTQNILLDASIFAPLAAPSGKALLYPTIIFITSWGTPKFEYDLVAHEFARMGYQVLVYIPRGFYGSGGPEAEIGVASATDINDAKYAVDWVIAQYRTNPNAIGMAGVSYGAGLSLMAAANDERIRAIVPMSGWGDLQESLAPSFTPRLDYINLLNFLAILTGHRSPEIQQNIDNLVALQNIPNLISWARQRSPYYTWNKVNQRSANNKLALYAINNSADELFQADTIVDLIEQHQGPARFDFNLGPHGAPEVLLQVLPTYTWNHIKAWFNHYLMGIDNGIQCTSKINLSIIAPAQGTPFREGYSNFVGKDSNTQINYALTTANNAHRGSLTSAAFSGSPQNLSFNTNEIMIENGWLIEQILGHRQWDIANLNTDYGLVFTSAALTQNIHLRGSVRLSFRAPIKYTTQFFAYLLEYDPNTQQSSWISHGSFSYVPEDGSKPTQETEQQINIRMLFTTKDIKQGNQLVLAIDGKDSMFLAAPGRPTTNTVLLSNTQPANLSLPITVSPSLQVALNPFSLTGPTNCPNDIAQATQSRLGQIDAPPVVAATRPSRSSKGGGSSTPSILIASLLMLAWRCKVKRR